MTKRISKYVRRYTFENYDVLYCMFSNDILILTPELSEIFQASKDNIVQIQNIHPDFYRRLISNRFFVDIDEDEPDYILKQWREEDENPKSIKLTINPTLQCNLRCWYCYESHVAQSYMGESVMQATQKYISTLYEKESLEKLVISFFGGEPLLYFAKIVKPIIIFALNESILHNKELGLSFTTNGTLLSEHVCDFLKSTRCSVSFQITLDGIRDNHNNTRFLRNGHGTYNTIVPNIKRAVSWGFSVNVRFNYTNTNYSDCAEILKEFVTLDEVSRRLINFSFHKVWQEDASPEMEDAIIHTKEQYLSNGFDASVNNGIGAGHCYADYSHNVVINYDGMIYKCTARDFTLGNAEGKLQSDGIIIWNDNAYRRESRKFGALVCQNCAIFPICHNGCSQDKLENLAAGVHCPRGYHEFQKEIIAKAHASTLLKENLLKI